MSKRNVIQSKIKRVVLEVLTERELRRFVCRESQVDGILKKIRMSGDRVRGKLVTPLKQS